jgi:hypothetical protein
MRTLGWQGPPNESLRHPSDGVLLSQYVTVGMGDQLLPSDFLVLGYPVRSVDQVQSR